MKSAGIVRVSGVRNIGSVVRYNEQEQKISGHWNGQDHSYAPAELCSYQGASQNGGPLVKKGTSFIRNGLNNQALYHLRHPSGHAHDTEARTIIQSFDYRLNPNLTPGTVHAMGQMFSDELRRYFQNLGRPLNDTLISTHLDRQQPKQATYDTERILQPHLHSHILVHSFNSQGEALAPLLRKNNLYDLQNINDKVVDRFDLKDYRFAKLQHLVYPISSKTNYRDVVEHQPMSNLEKASQRYLNANRIADQQSPHDFVNARKYRDRLLKASFGYHTKQVNDLQHATSRDLFTMRDFKDKNGHPLWYNLNNMQALQWRDRPEARAERFITRLDFNGAMKLAPTHREYQKTLRYAAQADQQATAPKLQKRTEDSTPGKDQPDLRDAIQYHREPKSGHTSHLISLQKIFQRVRREEEKIKRKASEYVQKVKAQWEHVQARIQRRHKQRHSRTYDSSLRMQQENPDYRTREINQYLTIYGTDRHGKVRPYRTKQRIHPQRSDTTRKRHLRDPSVPKGRTSPKKNVPPKRKAPRPHPHF